MTILTSNDASLMILHGDRGGPYVSAAGTYYATQEINGDVRYNLNNLEVYCDGIWMVIGEDTTDVQVSPRWQTVLEWAEGVMLAEAEEKELLKKNPALQKAKDHYNTIKALIEND